LAKDNHLYYRPTQEGMDKIEKLRSKVIELDDLIDELTASPDKPQDAAVGRLVALSKTKLEEARQRAIEAIVRKHSEPPAQAA
jgi:hypothetical protein